MIVASVHHFLTFWNIPSWAVAVGTVFLGAATVWLGTQARSETKAVGMQVELEQQQLEAGQRPVVLPITEGWGPWMFWPGPRLGEPAMGESPEPWMMLSNAGAGPAINIRGGLYWHGGFGGGWQFIPSSIGAGEHVPTKLEVHVGYEVKWSEAVGFVRYLDLAETEWQTHFRYRQDTAGQYSVEVIKVGKTSELGEPDYEHVLA